GLAPPRRTPCSTPRVRRAPRSANCWPTARWARLRPSRRMSWWRPPPRRAGTSGHRPLAASATSPAMPRPARAPWPRARTASSPALALGYNQRSYTELRTEVGAWFDKLFDLHDDAKLAIRTRAAWAHVISNNPNVGAGFQMLPDSSFSVGGTPPVADLAVL